MISEHQPWNDKKKTHIHERLYFISVFNSNIFFLKYSPSVRHEVKFLRNLILSTELEDKKLGTDNKIL